MITGRNEYGTSQMLGAFSLADEVFCSFYPEYLSNRAVVSYFTFLYTLIFFSNFENYLSNILTPVIKNGLKMQYII